MTNLQLLTVCVSLIIGVLGVASIFVNGWVKVSQISELKTEIKELWAQVTKISVLETKVDSIEKGISEIKEMLRH